MRRKQNYILGVLRRTALWAIFLVILGSISMGKPELLYYLVFLVGAYILNVLIDLIIWKIKDRDDSLAESYFHALGYDLIAPFSKIGTFIAVLTRK